MESLLRVARGAYADNVLQNKELGFMVELLGTFRGAT